MGLVYNTNTGKTEYLVELAGDSSGPITINFVYMQDTEPSNPQEKDIWFDTTNNKIYTYKDGQWTEPKDPQVGVFYLYNDEYYLWDGNSLEKTDLNIYEKIENKTDNFIEDSSVKYPSSKALSDGLKSVEPNLYDIKKLSQAVIDKGWTYLCNSTKQMLPKAKIPIVYNDIENKYLNCDKVPASSPANFGSLVGNSIDIDNTYLYASPTSDYKLKRTRLDGLPTLNWEIIENSKNVKKSKYRGLCVGNKIIICCFNGASSSTDICVYRKSDMTLLKTYNNPNNNGMEFYCSPIYINNVRKFVIGYKDTAQSEDTSYMVLLEDSETLQETKYTIPYQQNCVPVYVNGYYVFMTRNYNSNRKFFIRTQDFINFENCGYYDGYSYDPVSPIYKANNKLFTYKRRVSTDNGESWAYDSSVPDINTNQGTNNGCQKQNSFYIVNGTSVLFTDTLTTFRTVYSNADVDFFVLVNDSADMIFTQNHTNNNLFYIGYDNVIYTDTYTINGTTVNIQYYKFEDWKICISDGGTNDTNLDTIYNGLGYENYWLLDRSNEQLCLPRNSNLYTQMYVGNDYLDVTVPTGNFTRLLTQSNLITDITSTSITFDSTNKVQPNTDYEYGELTTLTLDSSSIISSKLGTTIKFQSGTTATIITDSSNIQWVDRATPEPSASKTCLIFIWDNTGFYKEW